VSLGVCVLVVAASGVAPRAAAQDGSTARAEREQVRGQRAQLALQIDALKADDSEIDRAVRDIEENLRGQQAMLADAERAATEAQRVATESEAAARQKQADLSALQAQMTRVAVDAYVKPPADDVLDRLKAETATDAAQKQALLEVRATRAGDLVDQLRATRYEYEQQRALADRTRVESEQRQREAKQRLIELQQARAVQEQFSSQLEARLNAKLAEASALAGVDKELSNVIAAEQAALAAQLRRLAPASPPSVGGSNPPPPPSVAPVPLATVRGITVNRTIAGPLEAMLAAAAADGIVLRGTGYRDPAAQIELRRAHCGPSYYEIYVMPPFECVPPTAIPGSSMHEQGLAIDFTWNGQSITTQSSPAFVWLAANAARFGFYNLPSEPWHWSVSGK
jgi:hypothetical protein